MRQIIKEVERLDSLIKQKLNSGQDIPSWYKKLQQENLDNYITLQSHVWPSESSNPQNITILGEKLFEKYGQKDVKTLEADAPITDLERDLIAYLIDVGRTYYGPEVYTYEGLEDNVNGYGRADYYINLARVGRFKSPNMNQNRYDNFELMFNEKKQLELQHRQQFDNHANWAINTILTARNVPDLHYHILDDVRYSDGELFATKYSNGGDPYYKKTNLLNEKENVIYMKSYELINERMPKDVWPGQFPYQALARDQMSGFQSDENGVPKWQVLTENGRLKVNIDNKTYYGAFKDNKTRHIFGGMKWYQMKDRITASVVKTYQKTNPIFMGWTNTLERMDAGEKEIKWAKDNGYVWVNVDWSKFDAGVSKFESLIFLFVLHELSLSKGNDKSNQAKLDSFIYRIAPAFNQSIRLPKRNTLGKLSQLIAKLRAKKTDPDVIINELFTTVKSNGGIISGSGATQLQGCYVNLIRLFTSLTELYKDYTSIQTKMYREIVKSPISILSDDGKILLKSYDDIEKLDKILIRRYGSGIANVKQARGHFFLQLRTTFDQNGKIVHSSPSPRYFWKLFFGEYSSSGRLGLATTIIAQWMLLNNFLMNGNPEANELLALYIHLDKYQGGLAFSAKQIRGMASAEAKRLQKGEDLSVATLFDDGDPSKLELFEEDGNIKLDFVQAMLERLKQARDECPAEKRVFAKYFN